MKNKLTNTESFLINGIRVLIDYDDYDIYENKLRIAAYNAMKKDVGYIRYTND